MVAQYSYKSIIERLLDLSFNLMIERNSIRRIIQIVIKFFFFLKFRNNRRIRAKEIIYSHILRKYINDLVTNKASKPFEQSH